MTTITQDSLGNIVVFNVTAQKAGIAFICILIFFFASVWGPVAWVVTGDIFPLKVRVECLCMATATNRKTLLPLVSLFQLVMKEIKDAADMCYQGFSTGPSPTHPLPRERPGTTNLQSRISFIWSGCCFLWIAFVSLMIYESKASIWSSFTSCTTRTSAQIRALAVDDRLSGATCQYCAKGRYCPSAG
jgi:hypothetical protein